MNLSVQISDISCYSCPDALDMSHTVYMAKLCLTSIGQMEGYLQISRFYSTVGLLASAGF